MKLFYADSFSISHLNSENSKIKIGCLKFGQPSFFKFDFVLSPFTLYLTKSPSAQTYYQYISKIIKYVL
jgi:hypothetical protein